MAEEAQEVRMRDLCRSLSVDLGLMRKDGQMRTVRRVRRDC